MKDSNKRLLARIRATLNGIEVRGADNLNGLLGCIQALDGLIAEEEAENDADAGK